MKKILTLVLAILCIAGQASAQSSVLNRLGKSVKKQVENAVNSNTGQNSQKSKSSSSTNEIQSSWICRKCGTANKGDYCKKCGALNPEIEAAQARAKAKAADEAKAQAKAQAEAQARAEAEVKNKTVAELQAIVERTERPWFMSKEFINADLNFDKQYKELDEHFADMTKEEVIEMRDKMNKRLDAVMNCYRAMKDASDNPYCPWIDNIFQDAFIERQAYTRLVIHIIGGASFDYATYEGNGRNKKLVVNDRMTLNAPRMLRAFRLEDGKWHFSESGEKSYNIGNQDYIDNCNAGLRNLENSILLTEELSLPDVEEDRNFRDLEYEENRLWEIRAYMPYAHEALTEALSFNDINFVDWKPAPKPGSMHATYATQALAAAKKRIGADVIQVVIASDQWYVERNAAGAIIRRTIGGWYIRNRAKNDGKYATHGLWAQEYEGNGYGALYMYGVAGDSFSFK